MSRALPLPAVGYHSLLLYGDEPGAVLLADIDYLEPFSFRSPGNVPYATGVIYPKGQDCAPAHAFELDLGLGPVQRTANAAQIDKTINPAFSA